MILLAVQYRDREEIAKIVGGWKRHGVVHATVSPYASLVLSVKQAGGKNCLCVDFRRLNKQTARQHNPLPVMLTCCYLQMSAETSEKTAFITADTIGEFTRMPFYISGTVTEFTRLIILLSVLREIIFIHQNVMIFIFVVTFIIK